MFTMKGIADTVWNIAGINVNLWQSINYLAHMITSKKFIPSQITFRIGERVYIIKIVYGIYFTSLYFKIPSRV
jgi:hypothetical protein